MLLRCHAGTASGPLLGTRCLSADDVTALSRDELEAEVLRLRAQQQTSATAFGRPIRTSPAGHEELLSAVEKTRMPMILIDPNLPDHPIIFANRAFQELSGYNADELVGRNCRFLQGPDTDPVQVQRIRDALRDRQEIALDMLNYRRDGTPFINELYISPVLGADGRVLYHFGSQLDVTGFRKDHAQLDSVERRQRAVFSSLVDVAIVTTDRDGLVIDWNAGAVTIFGWAADEMRGEDASRFFTPEDRAGDRVAVEMRLALRAGRASDERWHMRKDGSRFWASGEMMPLRDDGGEHIGFVKVLRDRTDEHLAGKALRKAEERRKALLSLSDRLAEHDDAGELTDIACEVLGCTLGVQLVGYGTVDPVAETIQVERDWTADGAKSLAGLLRFRDFGSYIDDIKRGETVIVTDARSDPRTREYASALEERSARAFVNTPVFEHGRLVALLYVSTRDARSWSEEDLAFIREVAVRTRAATARRQAEAALRGSEAELWQMADALPLLVGIVDRTMTYRFANSAYRPWLGLSPEEVVGRTIPEITGEDGYAARRPQIEKALAGESTQVDVLWPTPDGRRRIADIRYLPRRDANGAKDGFYAVVQDVTEQRDAAALLLKRAATLRREVAERTAELDRVWRLSQELLVVVLPDGSLAAVNPSWFALLGWTEEELVGSKFIDFTHPDDLEATLAVFASVFDNPLTEPYQYRFRQKDGSYRWFAWTAAFEDGKVYASGRDTTVERQQAEQLIQSQKMEAVGQLTGGLAHDFNNLLAGISGSLELMAMRISQGRIKDIEKYMVAAQGASRRAAALTHRLLAFSRRQTLAPKATDVNALVGGMLDLIQRTVGPSIEVGPVTLPGLWPALVDPSQLENALLNLCINARDAMPGGGRITIETGNRWIDRHAARQLDMPEGQYLSLCVTDTGTGMPPEVIAKAFDPFFTTKPLGEGTGLGLSMIYGFAKQSGGQVRIHSEVGEGATVCIYLPRYVGEAEVDMVGPEKGPVPLAEAGETVLVVDDEPTLRMLIADVLDDLGYTAIEAADGAGGLKVLQSNARIDLLVTDVGLPGGMNGRQMADAARVGRPGLKVLFITGYAENALLSNGQLGPGMSVLTKPFPVDTLATRIRELISA